VKFGPDKLPSGPEMSSSDEIIIVEGRADVVTLMKSGIENTVAVEGTHVPKSIADLTKKKDKTIIAFLDGDRGGDLILRELMQVAKVDYIARAPEGKEVENLTRREVMKALQAKIPANQALAIVSDKRGSTSKRRTTKRTTRTRKEDDRWGKPPSKRRPDIKSRRSVSVDEAYIEKIQEIRESFQAILFNEKSIVKQCGVAELAKTMENLEKVEVVIFDGVVTQRLVDIAMSKQTQILIGAAVADIEKKPVSLKIYTFDDVTSN
jgi:DNA primase